MPVVLSSGGHAPPTGQTPQATPPSQQVKTASLIHLLFSFIHELNWRDDFLLQRIQKVKQSTWMAIIARLSL